MRKAFTLIELLVVIAIISILAAILFPVFAQAKVAAKRAQDLSNAKQNTLGHMMYADANDDTIAPVMWSPAAFFVAYDWQTEMTYPQMTYPYQKNWQIHRNPVDGNATDAVSLTNMGYPANATGRQKEFAVGLNTSYGYNYMAWSPMNNPEAKWRPIKMTQSGTPAEAILSVNSIWDKSAPNTPIGGGNWFIEAPHFAFSGTQWWFGGWQLSNPASWLQYGGTWPWFAGKANATFGDGHASSLTTGQMLRGVTLPCANCNPSGVSDQSLYLWDRGEQ